MCFDRNTNENRDVKFLECNYLLVQRSMKLTLIFAELIYCGSKWVHGTLVII